MAVQLLLQSLLWLNLKPKKMLKISFRVILIVIALFMTLMVVLCSCGTRKVQTEITKSTVKDKTQQTSDLEKEATSETKTSLDSKQSNDKTDEVVEVTKTDRYNGNGGLLETITATKKSKSTDKSIFITKSLTEAKLRTIEKLKTVVITIHETKDYSKNKKITTDRNGWYWTIGIVLVVLIGVYFAYRYFNDRV